jgi:hypothetical protein
MFEDKIAGAEISKRLLLNVSFGSLRFRRMGCKVFAFDSTNVRTPFSSI